jgi:L-iditol 2-dehydrogenase
VNAAVLYGKADLRVEPIEPRPLLAGEVRIAIQAALTCGTDLKVFMRGYHARMIVPPALFGHEMAGVISEVSPELNEWKIGDRVVVANSAPCGGCFYCRNGQENLCDDLLFLNGAYAESIAVPARLVEKNLLRLTPATKFQDAALVDPLACVIQGSEDCRLRAGQRLLVIGAGPIGLMFVALGQQHGCEVVVAGRGEARLEKARRLGARGTLDVCAEPDLITAARAFENKPFDVVIEAVGKKETWEAALKLVRKGGLINFFGGCPSGTQISLETGLIHYQSLRLLGSFHHTPRTIRRALELIEAGVIRADDFVDGECPLSLLPNLFKALAAKNRGIKTLVRVSC